jgi:hypothetical protein
MARGATAKAEITKKILEIFEGSFLNDKEIRIPFDEDGDEVQIKVTLTAAKVNVENAGGAISNDTSEQAPPQKVEITDEEKQNVQKLMAALDL